MKGYCCDENHQNRANKSHLSCIDLLRSEKKGTKIVYVLLTVIYMSAVVWLYKESWRIVINNFVLYIMLLSAASVDKKTHYIPNIIPLAIILIGVLNLIYTAVFKREAIFRTLAVCLISGFALFSTFYLVANAFKGSLGMGDVKLIAALGFVIGLASVLRILVYALILCMIAAALFLALKMKDKKDVLPFAPFICAGYCFDILLKFCFSL